MKVKNANMLKYQEKQCNMLIKEIYYGSKDDTL